MADVTLQESLTKSDFFKLVRLYFISTCIFIAVFLIMNTLYYFVTALVSSHYLIPTIIYYYFCYFDIPIFLWNQNNVIATFAAGPIFSFFLSLICLRMFTIYRRERSWLRLAFLWGYHHGFNMFFGAYVAGVISKAGFRHASNWAAIPEQVEYLIAAGAMICMFLVGFLSVKYFLQAAVSQSLIERHKRKWFITAMVLLPWLTGSIFIIILKLPLVTFYESLLFLMMFTSVVPVYIAHRFYYDINIVKWDNALKIKILPFILLVAFIVSFRVVLGIGILVKTTPKFTIELFGREPEFK